MKPETPAMAISFRDALDLLLGQVPMAPLERVRLDEAAGRVLRQEVRADRDFPPFHRVMMDGFALKAAGLAVGRRFRVGGSAAAGMAVLSLPGEVDVCIEVMTGAPLPEGADCIVPVEEVRRVDPDHIVVDPAWVSPPGGFIHRMGSDAACGSLLLRPGMRMGSREIGVAASCGAAWLEVSARPGIAVVATGDELVEVGQIPEPWQIRQSNAHALRGALERAGYPPATACRMGDDAGPARDLLAGILEGHEWLVLTGAVSKGARDFIPALLDSLGCKCVFHGVLQRPGKPAGCWMGPRGQVILALPGNPVSAITGLHAFVLPALDRASGLSPEGRRRVVPEDRWQALDGMTRHLPVSLAADGRARSAPVGNSGDFIGLLASDGFVTIPPRGEAAAALPFTPWF